MDVELAHQHLTVDLEATRVGVPRKVARWLGAALEAALGSLPSAPDVDLVVRRIDSGAEILRTHADTGSPEALLAQARADLATKTVADFVAEWRLIDDAGDTAP
ncbi:MULTISPECIES: hypothetical protein [unclassified Salinibacterium]|uniref:hypothetical protein n=1 Tax=unclassified Salinibacterium TaxID=2632331 RepID=UPI001421471E|nr:MULTISPECIES: hypothetical protein [unclassified Salinibacterium]